VWHLRAILVQQELSFAAYTSQLSAPEAVDVLPMMRTIQFPASAINADEGQSDGNWQVLVNMLEQSGVPDAKLEEDMILVHGDLSTKEKIDSLRKMCTIEHSSKNHLDFVVFVLGLFHLKKAATDAFWCAHIQLREGNEDPTGFMEYICHCHPHETGSSQAHLNSITCMIQYITQLGLMSLIAGV